MKKLTLEQLEKDTSWKKAVIVFTEDTWTKTYSEESRSYEISRDARYFNPNAISKSLFGDCLDGKDDGVRLDAYIGMYWKVDYCYIVE